MNKLLSHCMIARWGMMSLGSLIDIGTIDAGMSYVLSDEEEQLLNSGLAVSGHTMEEINTIISDHLVKSSGMDTSLYVPTASHVFSAWRNLILIIVLLLFISIIFVRMVKYRKR